MCCRGRRPIRRSALGPHSKKLPAGAQHPPAGGKPLIIGARAPLPALRSDAAALLRATTVVRHGRHIADRVDPDAQRSQGTHRRLTAGARALDPHVQILDALLLSSAATHLGGHLGRERSDLREPLKPWPPDDAQANEPPWRSVMVMMVLLNDAWT